MRYNGSNGQISSKAAKDMIVEQAIDCDLDSQETDNEGQVIIYTDIYRWKDGTYHEGQSDPKL